MSEQDIIAEAVKRAQNFACEKGLILGMSVAHPEDPIAYELISVDDDEIATVGLDPDSSSNGKEVRKQFPLRELFNPCVARDVIPQLVAEEINKSAPPGSGVFVVQI